MSYDDMAEDVLEVMNKLNVPEFYLLGHSMGGKVAMNLALKYPERVLDMVIVDIAPVNYLENSEWEIPKMIEAMKAIDLKRIQDRRDVDEKLKEFIKDPRRRLFFLSVLEQRENNAWEWRVNLNGIEKNVSNIGSFPVVKQEYEKPVLFIRGDMSNRLDPRYQEETKKIFPYAKFTTIHGAGHWVYADNLNLFKNIVTEYFTNRDEENNKEL